MKERASILATVKGEVKELLESNELFCGDDTHLSAIVLFQRRFGITLTDEQLKYVERIHRARRDVLKKNPHLDLRTKASDDLEEHDRDWFGKSENE